MDGLRVWAYRGEFWTSTGKRLLESQVPQVEDSAWVKADWLWSSCLLQPMMIVTPTTTQTVMVPWLLYPSQALSLQASAFVFQADPW